LFITRTGIKLKINVHGSMNLYEFIIGNSRNFAKAVPSREAQIVAVKKFRGTVFNLKM
jgi:hypothetical protein